ncbi:flagellin [Cupriavidus pinatubonensis]|uniref:flagellin n=1 Tax=Cupriavidus pinatubonensis TaxID=248026 RepID=UPI00314502A2
MALAISEEHIMLQQPDSFTGLTVRRSGMAGQATAMLLVGAGMACTGTVHAAEQSLPDVFDAGVLPAQAVLATEDTPVESPALAGLAPSAARGDMAGWKPVAHERLEEMRGGFDAGGLQVSFGIERAVYINGALVVATTLNIPDVGRITTDQAARLASTLGPSIVSATQATVNSALAGNPATAGSTAGSQGGSASNAGSSGGTGAATTASAAGASSTAAGSAGASSATTGAPITTIATGTGQVITNGALTIIQNGAGNVANIGALAGSPATVIQNSLNNQSIRSLMTIDASVNTLQAFRSQLANTALNSALMRAASMR